MKFRITMKDPDGYHESVDDACEEHVNKIEPLTARERVDILNSKREELDEGSSQVVRLSGVHHGRDRHGRRHVRRGADVTLTDDEVRAIDEAARVCPTCGWPAREHYAVTVPVGTPDPGLYRCALGHIAVPVDVRRLVGR